MKILMVFGTRPEAIKMCPLVKELENNKIFQVIVCVTGQHREMLNQVLETFAVRPNYDLNIMREGQSIDEITISVINKLAPILREEMPDLVLVHGDTTTSFAAALSSFYHRIPVGHVEAGLRTWNKYSPYPEEMNRIIVDAISDYHYAPTDNNLNNLQKENINENVYVTGNTVIDAFKYTVQDNYIFHSVDLNTIDFNSKRVILLTAHRRENWGIGILNICKAVKTLSDEYEDVVFVYPVHLNPIIRKTVFETLSYSDKVRLIEPIDVLDMHNLLARCYIVLTDSGGLQEEAPYFGKPVLVLRTETERPEAVEAGTARVIGVGEKNIYNATKKLLDDFNAYKTMARAINPYGDGNASKRIVRAIEEIFNSKIVQM